MAKKKEPMARVNTRITPEQEVYVKKMTNSGEQKRTEGEVYREILQYYIDKHK